MDGILLLCNISLPCHRNTALTLCVSVLCLVRHVRDHFCHYITKERPVSNAEQFCSQVLKQKSKKESQSWSVMLKPDDVQMYPQILSAMMS